MGPEEDAETAIKKSFVRLTVRAQPSAKDVTDQEFEQWQKLTARTSGMEMEFFLEQMQQKAIDIQAARKFHFDDSAIAKVLKKKPPLDFNAQKQSKMQFLVQCALSQMDISGIRDIEAEELEAKYQEALKGLHEAERESAQIQENWFDKRPNLFALKMINERNLARQVRDDRHALEHALETEQNFSGERNPFERRPCRPENAWDTKLTIGAGDGKAKVSAAKSKPAEDAAAPVQTTSRVNGSEAQEQQVTLDASTRLSRIMQAHKRANLLSKFGELATQQVG